MDARTRLAVSFATAWLTLAGCGGPLDVRQKREPNPDYLACTSDRASEGCAKYCTEYPRDSVCENVDAGPDDASVPYDGSTPDSATPDAGCSDCASVCSTDSPCTSPEAPRCADGTCGACAADEDCAAFDDTPACGPAGACVTCTAEKDDLCRDKGEVCLTGGSTCVACNENADCKNPTAPVCDDHACRGCTQEADCSARGEVCREATGACVACEPDAQDPTRENCANGNACHPTAFTCTGAPRRSVNGCEKCVSDSECLSGTRCVATSFKGAPHGSYCLLQLASGACPDQYKAKRLATSTLGVESDFCFPNDGFTTCEGLLDFGILCMPGAAALCGDDTISDDAVCTDQGLCSYGCDSDRDCSGSGTGRCIGSPGAKYCRTN